MGVCELMVAWKVASLGVPVMTPELMMASRSPRAIVASSLISKSGVQSSDGGEAAKVLLERSVVAVSSAMHVARV